MIVDKTELGDVFYGLVLGIILVPRYPVHRTDVWRTPI